MIIVNTVYDEQQQLIDHVINKILLVLTDIINP